MSPPRLQSPAAVLLLALLLPLGAPSVLADSFTEIFTSGEARDLTNDPNPGGVQLLFLGVIGEYLHRTYEQSMARPSAVVRERVGGRAQPPS